MATVTQRYWHDCLTIEGQLNTGRRYPAPHTKVRTQRTVQCKNMALLSNQITPNPQKSSRDKLTSTQIKLHNMHTVKL